MAKSKDGLTAAMETVIKLHNETHQIRDVLERTYEREENWKNKCEIAEQLKKDHLVHLGQKDRRLDRLSNEFTEVANARDEAINSKAILEEQLASYKNLLNRLLEPKSYLQIKLKNDGSVVLNITQELGEAVKFAQQAGEEDDCKWVVGYNIEEGISTLNVDAPGVLTDSVACAMEEMAEGLRPDIVELLKQVETARSETALEAELSMRSEELEKDRMDKQADPVPIDPNIVYPKAAPQPT